MYSQHLPLQKSVNQSHAAIASHGPPVKVSIKWDFSSGELLGPKRFQNLINVDRIVYALKHLGAMYYNKHNVATTKSLNYFAVDSLMLQARIKCVRNEYDESIALLRTAVSLSNEYQEVKYIFEPLLHILLVLNFKHIQDQSNAEYYLSKFNHSIAIFKTEGIDVEEELISKINVLLNNGEVGENSNPFLPKHLRGRDLEFVNRIVDLIDHNLANEELSVNLLSKELFLSHSQVYRRVLALTNYTVVELIRLVKLHRAKYKLENHLGSISEIASQIGYTRSHFSRAFSKQFGYSPKESC